MQVFQAQVRLSGNGSQVFYHLLKLDGLRLVALYSRTRNFSQASISYPNFLDWVRDNRTFSALAAWQATDFNLTGMGQILPE